MPGRVPQSSANEKRAARACGRGVRQGSGRALPLSEGGASGARLLARLRHVQRAAREAQRLRGRGRARDQRLPQPARAAPRRLVERVQEGARAVRRQLRER